MAIAASLCAVAGEATPAIAALVAAGVPYEVVRYRHDPRHESFGDEAVDALTESGRTTAEQVYKTLILAVPDGLAVAVLPVPSMLSLKAAAAALGRSRAKLADPSSAEKATGYVVGGISPFGQRKHLPTVVDTSALSWERVLCSAGKRGWDVSVHPQDLIRLTGAVTGEIRAQPGA